MLANHDSEKTLEGTGNLPNVCHKSRRSSRVLRW